MKGKLKQKSKKKKGSELLQKYMVSVDEFIKSKSGAEEVEDGHDHGLRFVKKKSRKELRKEKRKMKKAKMKSHYEGKKILSSPLGEGESSGVTADKQQQKKKKKKKMEKAKKEMSSKPSSAPTEKSDNSKTPAPSKKGKKISKLQESRKKALLEANEDEDREIKKLERYLGLNKRKNKKSLPQSFVADGLDYILGMLDSGSSAVGMYDDDDDMEMAKENFEKLDDSQLSDENEEQGDEKASEGSEEDMGSSDDENELDEEEAEDDDDKMVDDEEEEAEEDDDEEEAEEDDDEMVEEEEAEEEEMEGESDAAESNDENEEEAEEDATTSDAKSETVSAEICVHHWHIFDMLYAV